MAKQSRRPAVTVTGARQLRKALSQIEGATQELKDLHLDIATTVAQEAKSLVPVGTGKLADTIRPSGTKTAARVRAGFKRVPYAGVAHFGIPRKFFSSGREPTNFLYSALDNEANNVFKQYDDEIKTIINTGVRRAKV
jgi:hypothetical protein